jgi:hypothetical protein
MSLSFPLILQEVDARCPNGYHKSPSGDCERVIDTKGMPRCPNGYHRSPDGDCERVIKMVIVEIKSQKMIIILTITITITTTTTILILQIQKINKNSDKSNNPLSQIFGNYNEDNNNNE